MEGQPTARPPLKSSPGMVWKMWGNDSKHLCIMFFNGKASGHQMVNLGVSLKQGGLTSDEIMKRNREKFDRGFEESRKQFDRDIEENRKKAQQMGQDIRATMRQQSGYHGELSELAFSIREYAEKNQTLTPADMAGLEQSFFKPSDDLKALVKAGEVVVIWNAKKGSKILAYPKMALTENARCLDGNGKVQDSTPALIKQLLDEQK
jgi:hypothetical protein